MDVVGPVKGKKETAHKGREKASPRKIREEKNLIM